MLKKAQIYTHLSTTSEAGEEVITSQAQGMCLIEKTGILLRYPEEKNHGSATLIVSDSLAQIQRVGDISSRLTFIEQQLIHADYSSLQRKMDFALFTHHLSFALDSKGGYFKVRYSLLLANTHVADNTLEIAWNFIPD